MNKVKVAKIFKDAQLPTRKHGTDAGMDFYAYETKTINPGHFEILRTGITVEVPEGMAFILYPKGKNNHLIGAGVVDALYQPGQILVKVVNYMLEPIVVNRGDAICQGVFVHIATPEIEEGTIDELVTNKSGRSGAGGIVTQSESK